MRDPHDTGAGVCRFDVGRFDVGRFEKRTLDPAVAPEAWSRIEKLRIYSWKSSYAVDGPDWSVAMRVGDTSRRSAGSSAYPGLSDPGGTVVDAGANSFRSLTEILETLGR